MPCADCRFFWGTYWPAKALRLKLRRVCAGRAANFCRCRKKHACRVWQTRGAAAARCLLRAGCFRRIAARAALAPAHSFPLAPAPRAVCCRSSLTWRTYAASCGKTQGASITAAPQQLRQPVLKLPMQPLCVHGREPAASVSHRSTAFPPRA